MTLKVCSKMPSDSPYKRREDLAMWMGARDYYLAQGWHKLADAAQEQVSRIAVAMAEDFINGKSGSLLGPELLENMGSLRRPKGASASHAGK